MTDPVQQVTRGLLRTYPAAVALKVSCCLSPQGLLSNIRTEAGDKCMVSLSPHNSPLVMSQCGSKGSPVNIAQMVACVGQQVCLRLHRVQCHTTFMRRLVLLTCLLSTSNQGISSGAPTSAQEVAGTLFNSAGRVSKLLVVATGQVVNGQRAPDGFSGRALPHFPRGTRTPEGKGFVAASFYRSAPLLQHKQKGCSDAAVPDSIRAPLTPFECYSRGGLARRREYRCTSSPIPQLRVCKACYS
jgi:hypothetical protein